MEGIRSVIKEKIKSCISCDAEQCPVIKQRLDHHVMSHHSSASQSRSNQIVHQNQSKPRVSVESKLSIDKLDGNTSTSDLSLKKLKEENNNTNYKQRLNQIISEWSNGIPNISEDPQNIKQNKLNELTEKVNELYTDINNTYYESKLNKEIDDFMNSGVAETAAEVTMRTLKDKLVTEILELNKNININNVPDDTPKAESSIDNNNETKEIAVNTIKTAFKRKADNSSREYRDTGTQNSLNDTSIGDYTTSGSNKNNAKVYVDSQVQHDLSNVFPLYTSIINKNTVLRKDNTNETEKDTVFKRRIFDWLLKLSNEGIANLDHEDIYYDVIDELFNRLKPILCLKSYAFDKTNLLKDEIFNFTLKNMNLSSNVNDIVNLNKLANTLAINLSNEKHPVTQNAYTQKPVYKIKDTYHKEDFDVLRRINDVVVNTLVSNGIYSDQLISKMTDCILDNINSTNSYQNQNLYNKLFNFLNHSTGLSDIDIVNIINNITEKINKLNKLDSSLNTNESWRGNVISVYKSEIDLMGQSNNSSSPINRRKSSIVKNKTDKIKPEEVDYTNKISAAITSWLEVLPAGTRKSKNKKTKQNFVQNLTSDILDQVKLHSLIEENSERDKYITFFIYRWLNKYDFFENIEEAKPFVDQLLKKITEIPEPKNEQTKAMPLENEIINNQNKPNIEEEFIKLKNDIGNIFNDLPQKNMKIKDKVKKNKIIDDFVSQVQNAITEKKSLNDISDIIKNNVAQIINSDQKQMIAKVNKDILDKAQKIINNINLDTSEATSSAAMEASETILKSYITKYLEHRFDPEDSIARVAFTQLLKNELDNLSTPKKQTTNDSTTDNKQEEFHIDKLSKELEYINIITDWLKTLPLEESFYSIDQNIIARCINKLAKDIYEIEENMSTLPPEPDPNIHFVPKIEMFLEQLPISPQNRKNVNLMVDNLISQIANTKMSQGTCCQMPDCQTASSDGKENETEHNISNFIEDYIRNNSEEISQDDLKLEACILRFFEEIDQKEAEPVEISISRLQADTTKSELQSNETARRFSFELGYANEISQWLKNLPLKPLTDEESQTQVGNMVSLLAEKVYKEQTENKNFSLNDSNFVDYINNWILELPLDPSKSVDIPVAVQQLQHRLERVDVQKYLLHSNKQNDALDHIHMITRSYACCGNKEDLGSKIINEIDDWCNTLPIQSENENNDNRLKQNVATRLYQKIRELNMNPEYCNDSLLYRQVLSEEIEKLLNELPQNSKLQNLKDVLKTQLLNAIMEKRNEIKKQSSGVEYRHDLEKTIDVSMPNPVSTYHKESPGFKIYKDRLAAIFILENFDHSNDSVKQKYEERLKTEIDKYFEDVQARNSVPLSKDQIYNELYSALYSVPIPNESSIIEEVEEIKTRCEIDNWFETLPLKPAAGMGELLEWDQILTMLAKRLHEMEKIECGREVKMHNEITKWLLRLPIVHCQQKNIDYFANDLQKRLDDTAQGRKCLSDDRNRPNQQKLNNSKGNNQSSKDIHKSVSNNKKDPNLSITMPACCQTQPAQQSAQESKNPADIIIKIVETWCQSLPISSKTPQEKNKTKVMKEHIAIKIIMKISEMNMNPEIFEDDFLYNGLLEDELDSQLAKVPTNSEFNKSDAKNQLINAIETVKPLIKEEKQRYEYKHEIKNTIDNVLNTSQAKNSKTNAALASLRDEIADDFIAFEFNGQDNESSQTKDKIYHSVQNFLELSNQNEHTSPKPLILTNQLICELRKVSVPNENVIIEELKEIEIKFEIEKFFDEIPLAEDPNTMSTKNQVKSTLAKRLGDFEKTGYTEENRFKMKKEVIKYVRKLSNSVDTQKVDEFVGTLQKTYPKRMSISQTLPHVSDTNKHAIHRKSIESGEANFSNASTSSKPWLSLLPATPRQDATNLQKNEDSYHTLRDASTNYSTFGSGVGASSSLKKDQSQGRPDPNSRRYLYSDSDTPSRKSTYLNNTSQNQIPGISNLTDSGRSQTQNISNKNFRGPAQYQPQYPGFTQQHTDQQDSEERYTNTNNYYQNELQPNRFPPYPKDNLFKQMPNIEQGLSEEQKRGLDRHLSVSRDSWMSPYDIQNRQKEQQQQMHGDMSVSDFGSPHSCMSHTVRRPCRRPSMTIFSPSYLEPEMNESQETICNKNCASKKKLAKEKVECRCEKTSIDNVQCKCETKEEEKIHCKCEKKEEEKIHCKCGKKGKRKPNWCLNRRKYCKYCNRVHPFDCGMLNYPNCYY